MRRDLREAAARLAHQRQVVVEGQGGIVAALQEHGGGALAAANSTFAITSSTVSVYASWSPGLR